MSSPNLRPFVSTFKANLAPQPLPWITSDKISTKAKQGVKNKRSGYIKVTKEVMNNETLQKPLLLTPHSQTLDCTALLYRLLYPLLATADSTSQMMATYWLCMKEYSFLAPIFLKSYLPFKEDNPVNDRGKTIVLD